MGLTLIHSCLCHVGSFNDKLFFRLSILFFLLWDKTRKAAAAACCASVVLSLHSCAIVSDRWVFQLHYDNLCNIANFHYSLKNDKHIMWSGNKPKKTGDFSLSHLSLSSEHHFFTYRDHDIANVDTRVRHKAELYIYSSLLHLNLCCSVWYYCRLSVMGCFIHFKQVSSLYCALISSSLK